MSKFEILRGLKIESVATALKYVTRADFSERRQQLIDSVCREVLKVLRTSGKSGAIDSRIDDDGDISFRYEHSTFHFVLACRPTLSGGQFRDLYDHALAFEILKTFLRQVISALGLTHVDVFTVDFNNVFNIAPSGVKNHSIFQKELMPDIRRALSPLVREDACIGRVDFKIGWDYDERRTCYYSVECPANEENSTVWTSLNVRTRDDILVSIDDSQLRSDLDFSYEVYTGPYEAVLRRLLGDTELDFTRRLLIRP